MFLLLKNPTTTDIYTNLNTISLHDALPISKEDVVMFIKQNEELLYQVVLPAYQSLGAELTLLIDPSIEPQGLASKPDGKDYYELLLISETGSYRTIDEIKEMLSQQFSAEYEAMNNIFISSNTFALSDDSFDLTNAKFPYHAAAQMLADLQIRMSDFPQIDVSQEVLPAVIVKSVSESMENYSAPAFYLTPPLDDTMSNVIYINNKNPSTGFELYTTLGHEGYPGHLYQSVYSTRSMNHKSINPVRELLWYGGYMEGWALYVEFIAYDYASTVMIEQGEQDASTYIQLEKHNRSLQLCLYSLLDILIHYENASYQQIATVLERFGITSNDAVTSIYEYIVEEPTNYLKYYLGYLEIESLRFNAQEKWGDDYTDYRFHEFILDNGPADFRTLQLLLSEEPLTFSLKTEKIDLNLAMISAG